MPDGDFELVTVASPRKTNKVHSRHKVPGRRIKEIQDPKVAKKLSRFSSAPSVTEKPRKISRSRGRVRANSTPTTAGPPASRDGEDSNHGDTVEEEEEDKSAGHGRVRRPPSLTSVVRHRFRGGQSSRGQARAGQEGRPGATALRQQRLRVRGRRPEASTVRPEVEVEGSKRPSPSPRRIRPASRQSARTRPGAGDQERDAGQENGGRVSTVRARTSLGRRGSVGSRVRNPVGRKPATTATTTTSTAAPLGTDPSISTTTSSAHSSTTTTEKVTISPTAHVISYTLEDSQQTDPVIVELDIPDYLELETEQPVAEELRSSRPVSAKRKSLFSLPGGRKSSENILGEDKAVTSVPEGQRSSELAPEKRLNSVEGKSSERLPGERRSSAVFSGERRSSISVPGVRKSSFPEEVRRSVPVPGDVFSQATHQLMRSQAKLKTEASFRPTLLPRRSASPSTVSARQNSTSEIPEVDVTVKQVIQEYVKDVKLMEAVAAEASNDTVEESPAVILPPVPAKRGRFILAIGANG